MEVYDVPDDYKTMLGPRIEQMKDPDSVYRAGDPARAAEIIVKTVKRESVPSHLLLGVNAVEAALRYSRSQLDEATTWRSVAVRLITPSRTRPSFRPTARRRPEVTRLVQPGSPSA